MSSTAVDEALAATAAAGPGNPIPYAELAPTDLGRGTLVSRYVVLAKLGAGGMGVVFAAYDPELDRKVALKLLHPRLAANADPATTSEARTRLFREAQALGKLNHPHIVAIHDVGEHQGMVWLAMEYVDGETLSAWSKQQRRTWREVLAVMTPAARGLSAAHNSGLVHRDVKPDNIMVGTDGRVRVMDLGLAGALGGDEPTGLVSPDAPTALAQDLEALAARVTRAGAVMGTPAYMSPEQYRGQPVDARADVFSFCVTLWEALMGERPFAGDTLIELAANVLSGTVRPASRDPHAKRVPGWLRRVCLRGLAVEPERRFASMQALLDALSHGWARARTRKWLLAVVATAAVGASAVAYQRHDRAERITACKDAGASIFDVWSDEARTKVREGIVATGLSYAPVTADKVMPILDAQAEAWREHRTRACLQADIEGTLDAEHSDRAVWCLDERRMELGALLTELSRADASVVQKAVTAAAGLPPVSPCTDGQVLATLPSPPAADMRAKADAVRAALSQALALSLAGKYPEGLKRTHTALAIAEELGWPLMTASVLQVQGALLEDTGAYAEAEAASLASYMIAAEVQAWDVAAIAARDLVYVVGWRGARYAEGKVWAGHAKVAVLLAGDPLGLLEAYRLNNLAVVQHATGAYAEAIAFHEQALALWEKALGPEHPKVGFSLGNLGHAYRAMGMYTEAKALSERAVALFEKALGPEHPLVATSLASVGLVHKSMGEYSEARALFERAWAILEKALGPEHPDVATVLHNLASVHRATGAYTEAKVLGERALAVWEKALGPAHPFVAGALGTLGDLALEQGQPAEALALLERAVAIYDAHEGAQEGELETRFNLARALVRVGGDRTRALGEARKAADGYREAGKGMAVDLEEVEAFLALMAVRN